jgi:hypothetical protein
MNFMAILESISRSCVNKKKYGNTGISGISGDVLEDVNQGSVLVMCGEERGRAGEGDV